MQLDHMQKIDLAELSGAIAGYAPVHDRDGSFPREAFAELARRGLLARPPMGAQDTSHLLALLAAIGEGDLNTGRIYEGHVNACWLLERFGGDDILSFARQALSDGAIFGVWNTDAPGEPLHLENGHLVGKKNFASGVDGLSHAIVTVPDADGRRVVLVDLKDLPVDRSWWNPVGMRSSGSHVVDFTGVRIGPDRLVGAVDDYVLQPWFSAGAMRFLAVQAGGIKAIFSIAVDHLRKTGRADNPYQAHRLARMGAAVETAFLWLERCALLWANAEQSSDDRVGEHLVAAVNGARGVIEALALDVLTEAEQAIGAAGMLAPHRFERVMRDLRTYLRQPNPDGAAAAFGSAIATEQWAPNLAIGSEGEKP